MKPEGNSPVSSEESSSRNSALESLENAEATNVLITRESGGAPEPVPASSPRFGLKLPRLFRYDKLAFQLTASVLIAFALLGLVGFGILKFTDQESSDEKSASVFDLSAEKARESGKLSIEQASRLDINGRLRVSDSLVLAPSGTPTVPTTGQLYYDKTTNTPYYYNGTSFISLGPTAFPQHVTSIGGVGGTVVLGNGLELNGSILSLSGDVLQAVSTTIAPHVSSLQGLTGHITLTAGSGININGTTITNSGVLSVAGTANQVTVSGAGGNLTLALPQDIAVTSSPTFAGLTLSGGSLSVNSIQQTAAGNDLTVSAGNDDLFFTAGGRTFSFPTSGPASQTICTTGISCVAGGGQAVLLQPGSVQTDTGSGASIFVNNTGGGNLVQLQGGGSNVFVVSNAGNTTVAGSLTISLLGAGLVQTNGSGAVSSGAVDRNSSTFFNTTLNVANGGTGAATFTANGVLFGNGTGALQATAAAANSVLVTNGSNVPSLSQTLPSAVQGNITTTGVLTAGSIASGFGTIATGNSITTTALLQGGSLTVTGVAAFQRGVDYSITGTSDDVNFGSVSLVRLTGASTQTITGISGGTDGRILTIINAAGQVAAIANNNAGSAAANRIITGTGGNIGLPAGSAITMVYDSGASLWRVTSEVAGASGSGVTGVGTIDSQAKSADGAVILAGNIYLQTADGSFPGLVSTGAQTFAGNKTFSGTLTVQSAGNFTAAGTALSVTNNASVGGTLTTGALSVTNNAAVGGTLGVTGNTTLGGTLSVTGTSTFNGNVNISGSNTFTTGTGTVTLGSLGAGLVQSNGSGVLSSGAVDRNSGTYFNTTLSVSNGGTGVASLTANGILFGNGTGALQATAAAANSVLVTNGSDVPSLSQTLPSAVQGNITTTGTLTAGSIASGFGTISTGNNITTTAALQGGTLSITSNGTIGGTLGVTGNTTLSGNLTLTGTAAFQRGVDYSITGTSDDVNFGSVSLVRLTGSSTQTITGITGGVDGRILTIVNAAGQTAVIANNNVGSAAANRITTGTGANVSLPAGSAITMVYDSGASLWRVTSDVAGGSGSGVTGVGAIDSQTKSADGAVIIAGNIYLQTADASFPGLVSTGAQTFAGNKTFSGTLTVQNAASFTAAGTALSVTNDASVGGTLTAGTLTVTNNATVGGTLGVIGNTTLGGTLTVTGTSTFNGNVAISGTNTFTVGTGTVTLGSLGSGLVQSNGSGVLSSGAVDRNSGTYFNTTLSVSNGGTGAASFTANGILFGNGTSALQVTGAAANSVLITNGSNVPSLSQTLPTAVQGNITGTGALVSGSIASGFGTISTGNNITTTAGVQGSTLTGTSSLTVGVASTTTGDINLANASSANLGTLRVASLGQATVYTLPDPGAASATICLSTGNCAGAGGGVTGSGTNNRLAKFTSTGSTVGDSTISDDGTNVTTSVDLIIQGGDVTLGVASTTTGQLAFKHSGSSDTGIVLQGPLTGDQTYTLPDASGEFCLSSGNCIGGGGGGAPNGAAYLTIGNDGTLSAERAITAGTNLSASDGGANSTYTLNVVNNPTFSGLVTANGGLTVETGDTFTFNGDAFTDLTGTGLQITTGALQTTLGTSVDLTAEVTGVLPIANGGTNAATAQGAINNISGLTTNGDLLYHDGTNVVRLPRGANGECLASNATTILWTSCTAGSITALTLAGTSGTPQAIGDGDTITIAAGTNITTTAGATDTVTVATVANPTFSTSVTTPLLTSGGALTVNATSANLTLQTTTSGNILLNSAGGTIELQDGTNVTGNLDVSGTFTSGTADAFQVDASGNLITSGTINGQTISSSANFTGTLTVAGLITANGGLTIQTGDTFTFNGDAFTDLTGNGLQITSNTLNLAVQADKGIEVDGNGISIIDCTNGEILKYNGSNQWACAADNGTGAAPTLQDVYNNSSSPATILTADSKDIQFTLANTTTDANFILNVASGSTGAFKVQNNGSDVLSISSAGQLALSVQGSSGGILLGGDTNFYRSAANTLKTDDNFLVQTATNSTTAFQVQNAAGASLFTADTSNSNITILGDNSGALMSWQSESDTLTNSREGLATFEANGFLYAIGGWSGSDETSTVYYARLNADGSTGAWQTNANALPQQRDFINGAGIAANGYAYVIGGTNDSSIAQTIVYYAKLNADGSTGAWTTTTALPDERYVTSVVTANGYMYVLGGGNDTDEQSTVYYAKLNSNGTVGSWSTTTALPDNRAIHSSVVANGYVYVIGGINASNVTQDTVYYAKLNADGTVGTWNSTTVLTAARRGHSSVVLNGYVYVIGGQNGPVDTTYYAKLNADGTVGTWNSTNVLPEARGYAGSATRNGYVYVIGGSDGTNTESTVYYASSSRLLVGGTLDLVGLSGRNLAEGGTGGELIAGNTNIIGTLNVRDMASFLQGVTISGPLNVNDSVTFRNATDSVAAFQVQNAAGTSNLIVANTTDNRVGIGNAVSGSGARLTVTGINTGNGTLAFSASGSSGTGLTVSNANNVAIGTTPNASIAFLINRAMGTQANVYGNWMTLTGTSSGASGFIGGTNLDLTLAATGANAQIFGNWTSLAATAAADGTSLVIGNTSFATLTGANNASWVVGANLQAANNSTSSTATTEMTGIRTAVNVLGSNNVTEANLFETFVALNGTGNIADYRGLYINSPGGAGSGKITSNAYGVYIDSQAGSYVTGNAYGIYQAGASDQNVLNGLTTFNGGLTVQAGDTFTFNGDAFTDLTGNGLQVTSNALTLALQANKGLEVDGNGLSLIDCASGEVLKYNGSNQWACAADNGTGLAPTLQDVYDNSSSPATILTADAKDILFTLADTTTDANFRVNVATGSTGALKVQNNGSDVLSIGSAGQLALSVQGSSGGLLIGGDANLYRSAADTLRTDDTFIAGSDLQVTTLGSADNSTYLCRNSSNQIATCNTTGVGAAFLHEGNSFGATAVLGTNDGNSLAFETNNTTRWLIDTNGHFLPNVDDTYDIGSDTARVRDIYTGPGTVHVGTSTSDEGTISYNTTSNNLTMGATNGVLIQNAANSTTAFQIQNAAGAQLLNVDTLSTPNLITNPGFEVNTTGWAGFGGGAIARVTTEKYHGTASLQITADAAGEGTEFPFTFTASQQYTLSLYLKAGTSSITDIQIGYTHNSGTVVNCLTAQTAVTTGWTRYTCTFTPTGTMTGSNIFVRRSTGNANLLYLDAVQLQTGASVTTFQTGSIQLNGVVDSPTSFKNQSDSTTAFQIQNAAGTSNLFVADTINNKLGVGMLPLAAEGRLQIAVASTTDKALQVRTTGDTFARFEVDGDGDIHIGSGTATADVDITRTGASSLQVRANLQVRGTGGSTTSFNVTNNASQSVFRVDADTTPNRLVAVNGNCDGCLDSSIGGWVAKGSASAPVLNNTEHYIGIGSGSITTTAAAGDGATLTPTTGMNQNTQYTLSLYAKASGSNFSTFVIGHQDVSGTDIDCLTGQTVVTTGWTRYSCTFTTGSPVTNPNIYVKQSDATARTFYIDAIQFQTGAVATPFQNGLIHIGSIIDSPVAFKNFSNSTTAFQIQNAAGTTNLFNADTINSKLTAGGDLVANAAATTTTATTSGTGTNTTTVTLTGSAFANGDVILIDNAGQDYYTRITAGGGTASVTVSPAVTFENARTVTKYTIQNIGATSSDYSTQANRFFQGYFLGGVVVGAGSTTLSDGNLISTGRLNFTATDYIFKNSSDSTTAFQIQNVASTSNLFVADTTNTRIGIGTTPGTTLLTIGTNTTTLAGGIAFGTDTNLYRAGVDHLKTNSTFEIVGDLNLSGSTGQILLNDQSASGNDILIAGVTGDSADRFVLEADGRLQWGSGSAVTDTNLYRSTANVLKTDDNFLIQTASNSTTAFQVQNAAGHSFLTGDSTNTQVILGKASTLDGKLKFMSANDTGSVTLTVANPGTTDYTITLPAANGTICLTSGNCAGIGGTGDVLQNGNSFSAPMTIGTNDSNSLNFETSGNTAATITSSGQAIFKNPTNSSTAFQIQNAISEPLFNVGTLAGPNLVTNGSMESGTGGWTAKGSSTIAQVTTHQWQGNSSLEVVTTTAASDGAQYNYTFAANTDYTVSFYAKVASGSITDIRIGRQDQSGTDINCAAARTFTAIWEYFSCTFTTGGTISASNIYIKKTGTSAETFYIDGLQLETGSVATAFHAGGNIQLNGLINSPVLIRPPQSIDNILQIQDYTGTDILRVDGRGSRSVWIGGVRFENSVGTTLRVYNNNGAVAFENTIGISNDSANAKFTFGSTPATSVNLYRSAADTLKTDDNFHIQTATNSSNAFRIQNAAGAHLLNVDTLTTSNLVTNGGLEVDTTGWTAKGSSTLTQVTTQQWQGNSSLQVATTAAANDGAKYDFTLTATTQYTLSLYAKVASGSITDVNIGRQDNGSDIDCLTGQTLTTSWTRFTCTFTTGGTISASNIYIKKTGSSAETFFIDGIQLETGATATAFDVGGRLQVSGIVDSPITFRNKSDSTTAFQIQNAAGTKYVLLADTITNSLRTDLTLELRDTSTALRVFNGTSAASPSLTMTSTGALRYSPGTGGTFDLTVGREAAGTLIINGRDATTTTSKVIIRGVTNQVGNILELQDINSTVFTSVSATGAALFKNTSNSTTAFQIQNAASANILTVDTATNSNLVTNGGYEGGGTIGWTAKGSSTLSQINTHQWQGLNSLQVATTTAADDGAKYNYTFTASTQYTLSFYAKVASGSITDVNIGRQDQSGTDIDCLTGQTLTTSWTRFTCTFTTGGTISSSNIYIKKTGSSAETFFVDGVQLQTGASYTAFNAGGALQLSGVVDSPIAFQNKQDSTTAFQIQNAAGTSNLFIADTSNNRIGIGVASPSTRLSLGGTGSANGITLGDGAAGSVNLYRLGADDLATDDGFEAGRNLKARSGAAEQVEIGDVGPGSEAGIFFGSSGDAGIYRSAAGVLRSDNYLLLQTATDSATAFQIQDNAGTSNLFVADTDNTRIGVGTNAPLATLHISSGGTDPLFRVTDTTSTARDVLNIADGGAVVFRNQTDSTTAFQIQEADTGQTLLVADTTNQRVAVGPASVPANGVLTVGTDTTAASGGLYFGTDTNLYRSAANELKTDDSMFITGRLTLGVDAQTIPDNGTGSSAATLTLNPTSAYIEITCNDADGCDITMDEASPVAEGNIIYIVNVGSNVVNFADTAGVSNLTNVFNANTEDLIQMLYTGSTWIEVSRADN